MRTFLCFIAAALIGLSTGCSGTPRQTYNQANEVFIATVDTAVTARTVGRIDDADWVEVKGLINEGNDVLRDWRAAVDAGLDPFTFDALLDQVLLRLAAYLEDGSVSFNYTDGFVLKEAA